MGTLDEESVVIGGASLVTVIGAVASASAQTVVIPPAILGLAASLSRFGIQNSRDQVDCSFGKEKQRSRGSHPINFIPRNALRRGVNRASFGAVLPVPTKGGTGAMRINLLIMPTIMGLRLQRI